MAEDGALPGPGPDGLSRRSSQQSNSEVSALIPENMVDFVLVHRHKMSDPEDMTVDVADDEPLLPEGPQGRRLSSVLDTHKLRQGFEEGLTKHGLQFTKVPGADEGVYFTLVHATTPFLMQRAERSRLKLPLKGYMDLPRPTTDSWLNRLMDSGVEIQVPTAKVVFSV